MCFEPPLLLSEPELVVAEGENAIRRVYELPCRV